MYKSSVLLCLLIILCIASPAKMWSQKSSRSNNILSEPLSFTYILSNNSKTSAGIYRLDSSLIRTLWSGEQRAAGTYTASWDGKDDAGNYMPDGQYKFILTSNNIQSEWGIVGNTSYPQSGETVHHSQDVITSMCFAGGYSYFCVGYNEGAESQFKFNINTPQQKIHYLPGQGGTVLFEATDGTNVYHAGSGFQADATTPSGVNGTQFVYATRVSDDAQITFSSGINTGIIFSQRTYSAIDKTISTLFSGDPNNANIPECSIGGMAVQQSGAYLFVSYYDRSEIHVLNKTTGALVQTITSFATAKGLCIDKDNDNTIWVISNGTTVSRHTINSNGTLTAATLTLSGLVAPLCLTGKSGTIAVQDGGTRQQVRFFSNTSGTEGTPLGQQGGYATNSTVANDKFMFKNTKEFFRGDRNNFIAYGLDGSLWVGDRGNYRVQHFSASNVFIETIMNIGYFYDSRVLKSDPTKVFANYLQFTVDYSNYSWNLTNNWAYNITTEYDQQGSRLTGIYTGSNGRTYALASHIFMSGSMQMHRYQFIELVDGGNIRFTGVEPSFTGQQFDMSYGLNSDGSLLRLSSTTTGQAANWIKYPITYDGSNNPVIGTGGTMAGIAAVTDADPIFEGGITQDQITASGKIITFNSERSGGYHLGAINTGGTNWLWQTAPSTNGNYGGEFPPNGDYDIGNGVVYPGSMMNVADNVIAWNYHGEFWKNSQVDKVNLLLEDGSFLLQAGLTRPEAELLGEAPAGFAGNAVSGSLRKLPNGNLVHVSNDEGQHGAIRIFQFTGLNTIVQQTVYITKAGDPAPPAPDYLDLMTDLPFQATLVNHTAGWTRNHVSDITAGNEWTNKTGQLTYKNTDRDLFIESRPAANGITRWVKRDLGANTGLTNWSLVGKLSYPEAGEPDAPNYNYFDILDGNDKVIVRISRPGNFPALSVKANNTTIVSDDISLLAPVIGRLQDIRIAVSGSNITVTYANYAPVTVNVFDPLAQITAPTTLRLQVYSTEQRGHVIDVANLKLYKNIPVNPLPVTFLSVNAYLKTPGIEVAWKTEKEADVKEYQVEKSVNGQQYTRGGTVVARGDIAVTTYSWLDSNAHQGNNYYRIKSIDKSGAFKYSKSVHVKLNGIKGDFEVYPNPVISNDLDIQFHNISEGIYTIKVINSSGQTIFTEKLTHPGGSANQRIPGSMAVPPGVYILEISGGNKIFSKQLIK